MPWRRGPPGYAPCRPLRQPPGATVARRGRSPGGGRVRLRSSAPCAFAHPSLARRGAGIRKTRPVNRARESGPRPFAARSAATTAPEPPKDEKDCKTIRGPCLPDATRPRRAPHRGRGQGGRGGRAAGHRRAGPPWRSAARAAPGASAAAQVPVVRARRERDPPGRRIAHRPRERPVPCALAPPLLAFPRRTCPGLASHAAEAEPWGVGLGEAPPPDPAIAPRRRRRALRSAGWMRAAARARG